MKTIVIAEIGINHNGDRHYPDAIPLGRNIEKINKLYDEGNTIIYWTARGATTKIDWYDITKAQLIKWGAKHHELSLDKPHFDMLIDDKAVDITKFME